jgi:hypothetical protein
LPEKDTIQHKRVKEKTPQQNSAAILITCMGIAVLLWLTNKLSHEYNGELYAKVNYINIPEGNILGGKTTQQLTLQIKTKGFNLLWLKLKGRKISIDVNINKLPQNRNFVSTNRLKPDIAIQIAKEYELLAIHPDTLLYGLDKKYSKTIPVVLKSNLEFEQQYGLSGKIILNPSQVKISGPRQDINGIEKWETELVEYRNLKSNKEGTVKLKQPSLSGFNVEPEVVKYTIPVEEFTEQEIEVEIKMLNVPKKTNLVLYPKKVKITCQVAMKDFDKVKSSQFRVIADFENIDFSKNKYVDIQVVQSPDFVKRMQHSPRKAEYIIYK